MNSTVLQKAEMSVLGSKVTIMCEFYHHETTSCVLIYREYNRSVLTVREFSNTTKFPTSVSVENSKNYTFSLFGKNSDNVIELEPVIVLKGEDSDSYGKLKCVCITVKIMEVHW